MTDLFSEMTIRGFRIKNRVVFPPMACFTYSGEEGRVTDRNVDHYTARAAGGAGLIIVETTSVSKKGRLSTAQLGIWSDDHIAGFRRLTDGCHQAGSVVLLQIDHAGLTAPDNITADPAGPSDYHFKSPSGRELSARALKIEEIRAIERDFVKAAVRAKQAGFDGVEVHAVHGHLISQFMTPSVNRRDDLYGGTAANRTRLAVEIIAGIREKAGPDFIIACRMACNDYDLNSGIEIAKELAQTEVDLLHVSTGFGIPVNVATDALPPVPRGFTYNWIVYAGTQIKKSVGVPVIVVNGIRQPEQAAYLVKEGLADFVSVGRGMWIDPEWANKAQRGQDVTGCLNCKTCMVFSFEPGVVCPLIGKKI